MKKLHELLDFEISEELKNLPVNDICDDSRSVTPGCLFAALKGSSLDGNAYIDEAISRGARYILLSSNDMPGAVMANDGVIYIRVASVRSEIGHLASRFFRSNFDRTIAITGTNGKSSTVDILRQILNILGISAASVGTLGIVTENSREKLRGNLTSPGAIELHKIFSGLEQRGVRNVAIEASSHGIHQSRLDGVTFDACAFTNLSLDHLDYHETIENYWKAKERLFSEIASEKTVFVANSDDMHSADIEKIAKNRGNLFMSYGRSSDYIKIVDVIIEEENQIVKILFLGKSMLFRLPIQGAFQVYNSLCAAAVCHATGIEAESIFSAMENLHPIAGRMELVAKTNGAHIYVDYAHTPDALRNAILSLRPITDGRLLLVFGCGGNRDQHKRSIMGEIASEFSDVVIVTDDNPRDENPADIRKMIMSGCADAVEIPDRKAAIAFAMDSLNPGDLLLVAGKGHEDHQQIGNELKSFSDKEVILNRVS